MALQPSELSALHDDVDLDRDRMLVERCQAGDSSAFGELYSRYYARVYRFCFRRLHDHEEAEDVAQDAFARAWRALPNFAGERRFYPWLTVIADNRCRDIQRRRVRSTPTADVDIAAKQAAEPLSADTPEDALMMSVEGDLAVEALGRLSPRHRQVLSLREGSGWTYQEIASHEGVEIRTVESLIWRARQALKREYASIAKVNGVIGGIAVGRWGAMRRAGGSLTRRVHPVAAVVSSTGGARGLATAVALTSFAVVAAVVPGTSQTEQHAAAAPAPAGQALTGQPGSRGGSGGNASPPWRGSTSASPSSFPGGPALPSSSSSASGAPDQTTVSPSATAPGSPATRTAGTGVPGVSGAVPTPGLAQVPSANALVSPAGSSALPPVPTVPAVVPIPPVSDLNQPTNAPTIPSLPSGSAPLTTPVEGLPGGK
ncbi:MAG TPA: RNA polymerase sigma factor [Acidimicrobiales bacterium]|jgi:RNA polymerase sigma-70 factor (ECF subfamily)|nr:RNA polymerase sigma factor [Acidimicrobiales bacterium]